MGNLTLKTSLPYILAALVGGGIIASTLIIQKSPEAPREEAEGTLVDSADWITTLRVVKGSASSTISTQRGLTSLSTSTADRVGRELLLEYALAQSQSGDIILSDKSAQAIAEHLVEKSALVHNTPYTEKDIVLAPKTNEALLAYFKSVNTLITTFNKEYPMNELMVLTKALSSHNPRDLAPLTIQIAAYKALEKNLLSVKAPPVVADLHLRLVQAFANIRLSVESMNILFTDTTQSLSAVPQYAKDVEALVFIAKEFATFKVPAQ